MIRNIELDALLQSLIAAEQGSFHRAGSLLGVQTSTISRRIRQLEARIGVSLFERHRHGIRPTDAGKAFLESTRRILVHNGAKYSKSNKRLLVRRVTNQ